MKSRGRDKKKKTGEPWMLFQIYVHLLHQEKVVCLRWRSSSILGVSFTSQGRMENESGTWIGAASAVMRLLCRSVAVTKALLATVGNRATLDALADLGSSPHLRL